MIWLGLPVARPSRLSCKKLNVGPPPLAQRLLVAAQRERGGANQSQGGAGENPRRWVSRANNFGVLLSARRLSLESVLKADERSNVSKIEQTRCDRS